MKIYFKERGKHKTLLGQYYSEDSIVAAGWAIPNKNGRVESISIVKQGKLFCTFYIFIHELIHALISYLPVSKSTRESGHLKLDYFTRNYLRKRKRNDK